jgi:regulatory protein YycH of two-component signal transduction system YycFG
MTVQAVVLLCYGVWDFTVDYATFTSVAEDETFERRSDIL